MYVYIYIYIYYTFDMILGFSILDVEGPSLRLLGKQNNRIVRMGSQVAGIPYLLPRQIFKLRPETKKAR